MPHHNYHDRHTYPHRQQQMCPQIVPASPNSLPFTAAATAVATPIAAAAAASAARASSAPAFPLTVAYPSGGPPRGPRSLIPTTPPVATPPPLAPAFSVTASAAATPGAFQPHHLWERPLSPTASSWFRFSYPAPPTKQQPGHPRDWWHDGESTLSTTGSASPLSPNVLNGHLESFESSSSFGESSDSTSSCRSSIASSPAESFLSSLPSPSPSPIPSPTPQAQHFPSTTSATARVTATSAPLALRSSLKRASITTKYRAIPQGPWQDVLKYATDRSPTAPATSSAQPFPAATVVKFLDDVTVRTTFSCEEYDRSAIAVDALTDIDRLIYARFKGSLPVDAATARSPAASFLLQPPPLYPAALACSPEGADDAAEDGVRFVYPTVGGSGPTDEANALLKAAEMWAKAAVGGW
ncbi:hypothetical protein DFJ73DRAFT_778156 [Zopfochytrium polystomum]|nr:hypothetical protein DFJ73DRAFT_778156 [Zopfochytrium polystomum]